MPYINTYIQYQYEYLGISSQDKCPRCNGYICSYRNKYDGFIVEHCEKCHFIYHNQNGKKIKVDPLLFFFQKIEDFPEDSYY